MMPIVLAAFIGFLAGQILGSVFQLIGATLTNYPGGLSALANSSSPPWWANAVGLVGLWIGFGAAIYYAYAQGNLRALSHQWQARPSDVLYVALGIACQLVVDAAYSLFDVHHLNGPVNHLFGGVVGA